MDPLHIGKSIGEDVMVAVNAGIASVANAAVDSALKQTPILDALLNGEPVTLTVSPITLQMTKGK